MIVIIDYGMGNLRSIQKAIEAIGRRAVISARPSDVARAQKIILPGVGAFGDAMRELLSKRLVVPLKDALKDGTPFLGLCLGLQLLFEQSEEAPRIPGLGVLPGIVKRFRRTKEGLKIPHMGWNKIRIRPANARQSSILKGVPDGSLMYFVHSYYVAPEDARVALTTTDYGIRFVSGIRKDALYGFQFHPEKSQQLGLRILRNFIKYA